MTKRAMTATELGRTMAKTTNDVAHQKSKLHYAKVSSVTNWDTKGIKCELQATGETVWCEAAASAVMYELTAGDFVWLKKLTDGARNAWIVQGYAKSSGGSYVPGLRSGITISELWASDGDPQAIDVDASGLITVLQHMYADDGVGSSPRIGFRGGSNSDLIYFQLQDHATLGYSDLVLRLADAAGESKLIIVDSSSNVQLEIDSDGNIVPWASSGQQLGSASKLWDAHLQIAYFDDTAGNNKIDIPDNIAIALRIVDDGGTPIEYLRIVTTDAQPEIVFNELSADVDVRIESDTKTHAMFVQGSDGFIGINKSVPAYDIHMDGVNTTIKIDASGGGSVWIDAVNSAGFIADRGDTAKFALSQFLTAGVEKASFGLRNDATDRFYIRDTGGIILVDNGGNVGVGNTQLDYDLDVTGVIGVSDNAGDPGTIANKATFYGKDVGGTVEAFAQDEAGNAAQLTPHNFDGPVQPLPGTLHWSQYHQNVYLGQKKWYDMERALLALEELTAEQFIFTEQMDALERRDWYMDQARQGKQKPMPDWMKGV